jgi:uncharacterized protein (UPF0248 family)
MKRIAAELMLIAKELMSGDSAFKQFAALNEQYLSSDARDPERILDVVKAVDLLRNKFESEYVDYVVGYLKRGKYQNPRAIFLGSLDNDIGQELAKKYLGKPYPSIEVRFNAIASRKISMQAIFKKAFDKHFGAGGFESALDANKK